MKIKIHLDTDQVEQIVAESLRETYKNSGGTVYADARDRKDSKEIQKACRLLYHYYTGENLK